MKVFIVLSALFACAVANGYGDMGGYSGGSSYGGDLGGYGGDMGSSYGHGGYDKVKIAYATVKTPIYKTSLISKTVKLGESHKSYPVQEARFTRSDYETPGATYAIPAVKTIQVTRPGYTTYKQSSITKTHVTNHQVKGPTYTQPIYKTVVNKVLVPVHKESYGHESYGNQGSYGNDGGYSNGGSSGYGY